MSEISYFKVAVPADYGASRGLINPTFPIMHLGLPGFQVGSLSCEPDLTDWTQIKTLVT